MKIKLLLFLLFIGIIMYAQDPKLSDNFIVEVGEEYKEVEAGFKKFYKFKDYVVVIKKQKKNLVIQKFDLITFKEIDRIIHEKFFKTKNIIQFEKILRVGNNIVLFYAKWDRKNKIESLEAQKISLETLEIGEQKEIIRQEGKVAGNFAAKKVNSIALKLGTYRKYYYELSLDEKRLLIQYRLKPKFRDDSKSYDRITINVFNDDLELDWKGLVEVPYTEKKMNNKGYLIDVQGNFYMLASVYNDDSTDEQKKKEKKANYHFELFEVKKGTNNIIKHKIDLEAKLIEEIGLIEDSESNIVLTGTFKNHDESVGVFGVKEGHATGIFTIKLNKEGEVSNFKSHDFPLELLKKYANKKEKKKIKKEENSKEVIPSFENLKLNLIAINNDGSYVLFGEQRYVEEKFVTRSSGNMRTVYRYYYRDIFAAKINKDDSLAWMHKLPKSQVSRRGKENNSYSHKFLGNEHYILFWDNIKNINLPYDHAPYDSFGESGGYFTTCIINDKTGEVRREAIINGRGFNNGKKLGYIEMDDVFALSDSEILLEGTQDKKNFLVKITTKK